MCTLYNVNKEYLFCTQITLNNKVFANCTTILGQSRSEIRFSLSHRVFDQSSIFVKRQRGVGKKPRGYLYYIPRKNRLLVLDILHTTIVYYILLTY